MSLHPLFEQILRLQIEATGGRPRQRAWGSSNALPVDAAPASRTMIDPMYPYTIYSNGVLEQQGKLYVPKPLKHPYEGPAYEGKVILVEETK